MVLRPALQVANVGPTSPVQQEPSLSSTAEFSYAIEGPFERASFQCDKHVGT